MNVAPRRYGLINRIGLWTLYVKEVRRFLNVFTQTIAAPVVTTLLFLAIFSLALGHAVEMVRGVHFTVFLAPGLIMMAMIQNAFANTSSSLTISKIQGNIVDVLMPPISAAELVTAYAMAGVTRGLVVGAAVWVATLPFVTLPVLHPLAILYHAIAASLMLALLGIIGGLWAEKFDHLSAVTNFIIMPLSFLSGTFYSVVRLPEPFHTAAFFNPFFYMIDGFRYGFIGVHDSNPLLGVVVMAVGNALLWLMAWRMIESGYRLKT